MQSPTRGRGNPWRHRHPLLPTASRGEGDDAARVAQFLMGLIIAAGITTLLAAAAYGYVIWRITAPADRRVVVVAALIALPLQPLAYYLVRMPVAHWLIANIGLGDLFTAISLFFAPLTEEPAKWLVLLIPYIRRRLTPDNAVALALATGLGFGIGEIWFIAEQLLRVPQMAAQPFYMFGGFLGERFLVCFLHGALVAFAFKWLADGRAFWPGALLGMALHFALNFPIFLLGIDFGGLGRQVWAGLLQLYLVVFTIALVVAVNRLARDRLRASILGSATCPECHAVYPRSWFGFNFLVTRYERCPHCRHWHWVPMKQGEPPAKA